jgi:predicted permease
MARLDRIRSALRHLRRGREADRELDAELQAYVELRADENVAAGASPEEARRRALAEMGGLEPVKEAVREARAGGWLADLGRDVARAGRSLRRTPGLLAVVVLTLGLGVGANTAIFGAASATLLEPLPYAAPDRLFFVWSDLEQAGYIRGPLSGPELGDFRDESTTVSDFASTWTTTGQLTGDGDPEQIKLGLVTANFFATLGVAPLLGRDFGPEDEGSEAAVMILGWPLWQRRFGGDPGVVGRTVRTDRGSAVVVGVMPQGFVPLFARDANIPADLQAWMPFDDKLRALPRGLYFLRTIARARPGVGHDAVRHDIEAISRRVVARHTEYAGSGRRFYAVPLQDDVTREVRPALVALSAGAVLLLLVAAVNVANVLLAQALGRRKETAVRVSLGASRRHLLRECLAQGLLLAGLGAAAGIATGAVGIEALVALRPAGLVRLDAVRLDIPVLAFALAVSLAAGLLASLAPLREILRADLRALLAMGGRGASHLGGRTRAALVVAQVGLGVVLLVGAGLLARTFVNAAEVRPGYRPESVLTFRLSLPRVRYASAATVTAFARDLERRLAALPGVEAVGAVSHVPLDGLPNWSTPYVYEAIAGEPRGSHEADARAVSPGYLSAVGAEIVEGRGFFESDDEHSRPVVVVDERLASKAWPGRSAVGQSLNVEFMKDGDFVPTAATVVGVVRHLRHRSLTEEVREQVYVPYRQSIRDPMAYVVRSRADPAALAAAVRAEVAALDNALPVYDVRPLEEYLSAALDPRRFVMLLGAVFAAVALLVAGIGTYGVVACSVTQREHEFGVRRALGARTRDVLGLVFREGLALAAAGLAVGLVGAAVTAPALRGLLFGVAAADPLTYGAVAAAEIVAALVACWLPARRAAKREPLDALRVV